MEGEPIFVVKIRGMLRYEDMLKLKERLEGELPGKVFILDGLMEDIYMLSPQDGRAIVRMLAEEVLPEWRSVVAGDEE